MKRWICLILALAMVLALAACGEEDSGSSKKKDKDKGSSLSELFGKGEKATEPTADDPYTATEPLPEPVPEPVMPQLSVGFGRKNITPDYMVLLDGGDQEDRYAMGFLDYLFATCVALAVEDEAYLVYSLDLKQVPEDVAQVAKERISQRTGVPEENIILNATNTHSSIALSAQWDGRDEYLAMFYETLSGAATTAIMDMAPAQAYHNGVWAAGMAYNRHYLLSDGTYAGPGYGDFNNATILDQMREAELDLQLVRFERENKKDVVLLGFQALPDFNLRQNPDLISADYMGVVRMEIEQSGDSLVACFMGAGADQATYSMISGEGSFSADSNYRDYGKALALYAAEGLKNPVPVNDPTLKYLSQVEYCDTQTGDNSLCMELRTLAIGDLAFVFAPYEMYSVHGQYIEAESLYATTFVVTCSEGGFGVAPESAMYDIGAAEAVNSLFPQYTPENLAGAFVSMLREMSW